MKLLTAGLLITMSFATAGSAQTESAILASTNFRNFTSADLPANVRAAYDALPQNLLELRRAMLDRMVAKVLLDAESKFRKTSVDNILAFEVTRKVPNPTPAQIKAVYDKNRDQIGGETLAQVRPQIVAFLRSEPEDRMFNKFLSRLKLKYKFAAGADVNSTPLLSNAVLATIGTTKITVADFDAIARPILYENEIVVYDQTAPALEETVYNAAIVAEAKKSGIDSSDFIAREITNKLREFSDEERLKLQDQLRERLFKTYDAKFFLKAPPPFVQSISVDDDPSLGPADAPVTVVMFSDFQCPACSATHPILKNVLAEYGDKVRFVLRDFPLIGRHKNAMLAAQAADAAKAQGKFFDYIEILYTHQDQLDAASLKKYAADLGLNVKQFEADMMNPRFAKEIQNDIDDGKSYGVSSTPAIFVNGVKVRQLSARDFRNAIESALARSANR